MENGSEKRTPPERRPETLKAKEESSGCSTRPERTYRGQDSDQENLRSVNLFLSCSVPSSVTAASRHRGRATSQPARPPNEPDLHLWPIRPHSEARSHARKRLPARSKTRVPHTIEAKKKRTYLGCVDLCCSHKVQYGGRRELQHQDQDPSEHQRESEKLPNQPSSIGASRPRRWTGNTGSTGTAGEGLAAKPGRNQSRRACSLEATENRPWAPDLIPPRVRDGVSSRTRVTHVERTTAA